MRDAFIRVMFLMESDGYILALLMWFNNLYSVFIVIISKYSQFSTFIVIENTSCY